MPIPEPMCWLIFLLLNRKVASEVLCFEWESNFVLLPEGDFSIKRTLKELYHVHSVPGWKGPQESSGLQPLLAKAQSK